MTQPLQPGDKGKISVEIVAVDNPTREGMVHVRLANYSQIWVSEHYITDHEPRAIEVGDFVIHYNGAARKVLALHNNFAWITSSDGEPCTHRLSSLTRVQDPAK